MPAETPPPKKPLKSAARDDINLLVEEQNALAKELVSLAVELRRYAEEMQTVVRGTRTRNSVRFS